MSYHTTIKDEKYVTRYTVAEWRAEAVRRFGENPLDWKFVCPSCGHVAKVSDWKDAGAKDTNAGFSCVGRWLDASDENTFKNQGGPCQYAGGGLFRINPVIVTREDGEEADFFAFAEA